MKPQSICLALAIVLLCPSASAQWVQTDGPYGGQVSCLLVSGTKLFVGTSGGVFLSTNNGTSWTGAGLANIGVEALAISTNEAGGMNLFAGTYGSGVFLSTNNGTSWTAANTGLTFPYVHALVALGKNLFAGTNIGVFLSTNNGTSWVQTSLPSTNVEALATSSKGAGGTNLFAGTHTGIFVSTNNGTSWTAVNIGLPDGSFVLALAVSGNNILAGTGSGVFRSTDNGTSWNAANTGLMSTYVCAFAVSPASGGTSSTNLFAGGNGVFLSTDEGTSWTGVNNGLTRTFITALAVSPASGGSGTNLFAGIEESGVFLSTNNGTNWTAVSEGLTNSSVYALAVSPASAASGTNLFAGGKGVFLSTYNGASWTSVGLANMHVYTLAVSPGSSGSTPNLFAATSGSGVFLSTDNGTSWSPVNEGLPRNINDSTQYDPVQCFESSGQNLFAGTSGNGIFLSTNNGASWTSVSNGLPEHTTVHALAVSGRIIFLAGSEYDGVFLSTNSGMSWTSAGWIGVRTLAVSRTAVFAGGSSGVLRSIDSGASWTAVNSLVFPEKFGEHQSYVSCFAVSGTNLFAAISTGSRLAQGVGIFLSGNSGTTWTNVSSGLPANTVVKALIVSGTNLYAATEGVGVWRRSLSEMVTSVDRFSTELPTEFSLAQNYPNPFNPSTTITYELPKISHVLLSVYNMLGMEVATVVSAEKSAGVHTVQFDGSAFASGVYMYRLQSGTYLQTKKMVLVK